MFGLFRRRAQVIGTFRKLLISSRRLGGALSLLLLSACAGGSHYFGAYVPADYAPKPNEESGVLLVSIGISDALRDRDYVMEFRRKGSGGVGTLNYPPTAGASGPMIEFRDKARHGVVVSLRLRPGEYEIYRYEVHLYTATDAIYVPWASKRDFRVPFSIVAGRTTYLGQIVLDLGKREGLGVIVQGVDNTGIWAVSDKIERDMDLAEKAGSPAIRANPLKEIPDPKELDLKEFRKDDS